MCVVNEFSLKELETKMKEERLKTQSAGEDILLIRE
jgi:hypothetical protein